MRSLVWRRGSCAMAWWPVLAALAAGACLDDSGVGPSAGSVRLALVVRVGSAATAMRVQATYARAAPGAAAVADGPLLDTTVPLAPGAVPPSSEEGNEVNVPLTLELAPCLVDPQRTPGGRACTVTLRFTLLEGAQVLDEASAGPLVLRPGETASLPPVTLREAAAVQVGTAISGPLAVGGTRQLLARALSVTGAEMPLHQVTWTSSMPGVATVTLTGLPTAMAAGALVTGVAPGTTTIRASARGRTGELRITVVEPPRIVLVPASVSFVAFRGSGAPAAQTVAITNASGGPMAGLAVRDVTYAGAQAGWLQASLSSASAPSTLTVQPTRTDLPPGIHVATVHLVADGAANAPVALAVSYEVVTAGAYLGTAVGHARPGAAAADVSRSPDVAPAPRR